MDIYICIHMRMCMCVYLYDVLLLHRMYMIYIGVVIITHIFIDIYGYKR
jgi:hypothetical protein